MKARAKRKRVAPSSGAEPKGVPRSRQRAPRRMEERGIAEATNSAGRQKALPSWSKGQNRVGLCRLHRPARERGPSVERSKDPPVGRSQKDSRRRRSTEEPGGGALSSLNQTEEMNASLSGSEDVRIGRRKAGPRTGPAGVPLSPRAGHEMGLVVDSSSEGKNAGERR